MGGSSYYLYMYMGCNNQIRNHIQILILSLLIHVYGLQLRYIVVNKLPLLYIAFLLYVYRVYYMLHTSLSRSIAGESAKKVRMYECFYVWFVIALSYSVVFPIS